MQALAEFKGKGIVRMNALEKTAKAAGRLKDDHDINDNIRMAGLKSACVENGLYFLETDACIVGKINVGLKEGRSKQTQNGHGNGPRQEHSKPEPLPHSPFAVFAGYGPTGLHSASLA